MNFADGSRESNKLWLWSRKVFILSSATKKRDKKYIFPPLKWKQYQFILGSNRGLVFNTMNPNQKAIKSFTRLPASHSSTRPTTRLFITVLRALLFEICCFSFHSQWYKFHLTFTTQKHIIQLRSHLWYHKLYNKRWNLFESFSRTKKFRWNLFYPAASLQ